MNTISWLIYAAEVVSRIGPMLMFVAIITVIGGAIITVIGKSAWSYYSWTTDSEKQESETFRKWLGRNGPRFVVFGMIAAFIAVVIPSQRTIYLIAASEIGETVVTHPETLEMFNDVKSVIQKRLREELVD